MKQTPNNSLEKKVSLINLCMNFLLMIGKFLTGVFAHSAAMISDATNSASDVFSTFIVLLGVKAAGKDIDADHQYGHERMECVSSILLSVILFATGLGIGWTGLQKIISTFFTKNIQVDEVVVPSSVALIVAAISIATKAIMFVYTSRSAKKTNSVALMAGAQDHISDVLCTTGTFIGIFCSRRGYPVMDSVASVVICLFILKAAVVIFIESINRMVDKACDEKTVDAIKGIIEQQEGVIHIDKLQTRIFGSKIYVDVEITADGNQPLNKSHAIAESVHSEIEKNFPDVKHCMVHVNPDSEIEHT